LSFFLIGMPFLPPPPSLKNIILLCFFKKFIQMMMMMICWIRIRSGWAGSIITYMHKFFTPIV
jgi:hypothetical protein